MACKVHALAVLRDIPALCLIYTLCFAPKHKMNMYIWPVFLSSAAFTGQSLKGTTCADFYSVLISYFA